MEIYMEKTLQYGYIVAPAVKFELMDTVVRRAETQV